MTVGNMTSGSRVIVDDSQPIVIDSGPMSVFLPLESAQISNDDCVCNRPLTTYAVLLIQRHDPEGRLVSVDAVDLSRTLTLTLFMAPPHELECLVFARAPGTAVLFSSTPLRLEDDRLRFAGDPDFRVQKIVGVPAQSGRAFSIDLPDQPEIHTKVVLIPMPPHTA